LVIKETPYGQYPTSGYNGRSRSRTEDGTAMPHNLNPSSPPLPSGVPNAFPFPQHRSHANMSMPPISRNVSASATMATFPSSVIHLQGENTGYFPNSPPSYSGSPAQSARSSSSTSSHSLWQRRSVDQQSSDTVTKVIMGNDDEYPVLPTQRVHSVGQTFQQLNGPTPVLQQTSAPNSNRLRSTSNSNIHAIQEDQWESMEPYHDIPTNNNIPRNNGVQSSGSHQRHSGSSTSSQTSNTSGGDTNVPISNSNLSSPTNGVENGSQYSKYNYPTTMKIKVNYAEDIFVIVVPQDIEYKELCDRIERKIRLCTTRRDESIPLRIKYQDEDGDHITIISDEDVLMAFKVRLAAGGNFVNFYVS